MHLSAKIFETNPSLTEQLLSLSLKGIQYDQLHLLKRKHLDSLLLQTLIQRQNGADFSGGKILNKLGAFSCL